MSPFVDEGLWDKWKARAAGYAQAVKNIAASGTTPQQTAQFRSLFKTFSANTIKTLTDFLKVIYPYWSAKKLTPEEQEKTDAMFALKTELENIKQNVTEANMFTRPFSVLGAQASGRVSNIMSAYQKILKGYFDTFSKDARALGMDPVQVLRKYHSSLYPMIQKAFGMPMVSPAAPSSTSSPSAAAGTPASAPTPPPSSPPSPPPSAPAPASTPTPVPPPPSPVAPAGSAPTTPLPVAPAAPAPGAPATPAGTPPEASLPTMEKPKSGDPNMSLITQLINKLVVTLQDGKDMLTRLKSEGRRMRNKTEVEFDFDNPPVKETDPKTGDVYQMRLQYRYNKNNNSHCFDFALVTTHPDGRVEKSPTWIPFIEFTAPEVISDDEENLGEIRSDFNVMSNIERTNPEVGNITKTGLASEKMEIGPAVNKALAEVFANVSVAMDPERQNRDVRAQQGIEGDEEDKDAPEKAGGGGGTTKAGGSPPPPPAPPKAPAPPKPGEPTPPEAAGRTVTPAAPASTPAEKPKKKPTATGVARKRKPPTGKPPAKPTGKLAPVKKVAGKTPAAPATSEKPKPGHKPVKRPVKGRHSVTEEFSPSFRDFFPL